jgi:hypothetical protein
MRCDGTASPVDELLCRLYDPNEGAIEIHGVDLREFELTNGAPELRRYFRVYRILSLVLGLVLSG